MIYLFILIDILVNNYSKYVSFFFITYLYNKSYKYYLLTGLILDLIIFKSIYNTIILSIIYLLNKVFKDLNKNNFYNYIFINLFNYMIYIIVSNVVMFNNVDTLLLSIGSNLIINIIFYILSFNLYRNLSSRKKGH